MPTTSTPFDEWIAGEALDYKRHYVVHAHAPRFIAEFLKIRTKSAVLHQRVEIDPLPTGDADRLGVRRRGACRLVGLMGYGIGGGGARHRDTGLG